MTDTHKYNGWTNWATWNVELWISNEEPLYRDKMEFLRSKVSLTASDVESFVRELFPTGTRDMDDENELAEVNWGEIADAWEDEISDNK